MTGGGSTSRWSTPTPWDDWLQDEINCAAAYWENAITADVGPPLRPITTATVTACATYGARYRDPVDDLKVVVHFADQRAAATAWACEERPATGLPVTARVAFASSSERYDMPRLAATANVTVDFSLVEPHLDFLYNVARHELGHALGFGSSSAFRALVSTLPGNVPVPVFRGPCAMAAAGGPVGMDLDGAHWSADRRADIMVARILGSQVATAVTLGAMADIRYTVDTTMAGR